MHHPCYNNILKPPNLMFTMYCISLSLSSNCPHCLPLFLSCHKSIVCAFLFISSICTFSSLIFWPPSLSPALQFSHFILLPLHLCLRLSIAISHSLHLTLSLSLSPHLSGYPLWLHGCLCCAVCCMGPNDASVWPAPNAAIMGSVWRPIAWGFAAAAA